MHQRMAVLCDVQILSIEAHAHRVEIWGIRCTRSATVGGSQSPEAEEEEEGEAGEEEEG